MSNQGVLIKRDDSVFWRGEKIGFIRRRKIAVNLIEFKFFPAGYGHVLREYRRGDLVAKIRHIYRVREIEREARESQQSEGAEL